MGCSCEKKQCAGETPPRVLELNTVCGPVLFHRVDYPATAGNPTTNPPETLNYKNVLLVYEATGEAYLYSSDGVPTFISYLPTNVDELKTLLEQEIANREAAVQAEASAREAADTELQFDIANETAARYQADQKLQTTIADAETKATQQISILQSDLETETTEREEADTKLQQNIDALENKSDVVDVVGTYAELEAYDTKNLGDNDIIKVLNDETHDGAITYYRFNKSTGAFSYVGETGPYYTKAEIDADLEGIDHDIDNLTELINGVNVPKVPNYVVGTDGTTNLYTWIQGEGGGLYQQFKVMNTTSGAVSNSNQPTLPLATATASGVMSTADKAKLDALLEIKSLNDSLELDENGQLSVVGGSGSDVNLLTTYTTSPAENDVYDASYMNGRLDNSSGLYLGGATLGSHSIQHHPIAIGADAQASYDGTAIGANASADSASVALGGNAKNYNSYNVAIGNGTQASGEAVAVGANAKAGTHSVAIGENAQSTTQVNYSVALGHSTANTRNGEVSIGGYTGTSTNIPKTRYLANVTAGELDTDAVNLKQMQDYVAEHAGGGGSSTLYSEYGNNSDGALTQAFVSEKLNSRKVILGGSATAAETESLPAYSVVIGNSASDRGGSGNSNNHGVAIGDGAQVVGTTSISGSNGIAIGYGAQGTAYYGVAIGRNTAATSQNSIAIGGTTKALGGAGVAIGVNAQVSTGHTNSVALGASSITSETYEVSIGSATTQRKLTHVKAGTADTDAVNVAQLNTATARAQNLPLNVFYNVSATDYNQEDITLHFVNKDLATGGDASIPLDLNAAVPATGGQTGSAGIMSVTQATQLAVLAEAYEAEEKGTVLYTGSAAVNTLELSEAATGFDHIRVVAEYTSMGSSAMAQSVTVDFYPNGDTKSFQMTATDITVGDTPMVTTLQDIWMLSDDGIDLDLIGSFKAEQGAGTLTCTPDTTSQFTIVRVVGFGKI